MKRRTLLKAVAATAVLNNAVGCGDPLAQDRTFPQGVGSADPVPDGVLLWTRVTEPGPVTWELARDEAFRDVAASGVAVAGEDTDFTVRVDAGGLASGRTYWYRFSFNKVFSPTGRTKTAPAPGDDVPLRIALASCQDYGGRYFHAWRSLAARDDIDLVLFIGDYIYESIGMLNATLPPGRTPFIPDGLKLDDPLKGTESALTLADYRALYRQYRSDPDLKAVQARFPFVSLWDDHEFANDCWQQHATDFDDARGDEQEPDRRAAATRAWYEYQPIRRPFSPAAGFPGDLAPQRRLSWGKHADLVLMDERYHRDDHLIPEGPIDTSVGHFEMNSAFGARTFVIKDAFDAREAVAQPTMLGPEQRDWAIAQVTQSTATWKLLVSPLMMQQMVLDLTGYAQLPSNFRQHFYFKTDQWDGFRSERRRVLEACAGVDNLVVLSGDLHGFYASELKADPDDVESPTLAVEYVVSAISAATIKVQLEQSIASDAILKSLGLLALVPDFDANVLATNPQFHHSESRRNGLAIVEVSADQVKTTFLESDDVTKPDGGVARQVAFLTRLGSRSIEPVDPT
jgi:alkaline phosphatase D